LKKSLLKIILDFFGIDSRVSPDYWLVGYAGPCAERHAATVPAAAPKGRCGEIDSSKRGSHR
jgi:hypothetical protein